MNSRWYKGLNEQQRKEMEDLLRNSRHHVFKALHGILDDLVVSAENDLYDKDQYILPAWAENHADKIGYIRAIRKVKAILPEEL